MRYLFGMSYSLEIWILIIDIAIIAAFVIIYPFYRKWKLNRRQMRENGPPFVNIFIYNAIVANSTTHEAMIYTLMVIMDKIQEVMPMLIIPRDKNEPVNEEIETRIRDVNTAIDELLSVSHILNKQIAMFVRGAETETQTIQISKTLFSIKNKNIDQLTDIARNLNVQCSLMYAALKEFYPEYLPVYYEYNSKMDYLVYSSLSIERGLVNNDIDQNFFIKSINEKEAKKHDKRSASGND